jgi:hypothetical protein
MIAQLFGIEDAGQFVNSPTICNLSYCTVYDILTLMFRNNVYMGGREENSEVRVRTSNVEAMLGKPSQAQPAFTWKINQ